MSATVARTSATFSSCGMSPTRPSGSSPVITAPTEQAIRTRVAAGSRVIGVTGQAATVDEVLTGRQNLVMIGRLSGLHRRDARATAVELLERFDLACTREKRPFVHL